METITIPQIDWKKITQHLGVQFARGAEKTDRLGKFVHKNYEHLKLHKYHSAMIPENLGGGGLSHEEMCDIVRTIGAHCGSTALAMAMHQHLVGASIWKYYTKGQGEAMLRKVAMQQCVLVSTGARDWLQSNGNLTKVNGGYLLNAEKKFASQSAIGDIAITSARLKHADGTTEVLHFPVALDADGVELLDDWNTLGMRGTGSQTIVFKDVFVSEDKIALRRPQEGFHPVWNVVLTIAMPLIMSAYTGIAERAFQIALEAGRKKYSPGAPTTFMIARIKNDLIAAQSQLKSMIALTNNFKFSPDLNSTVDTLSYKTNIADLCIKVVQGAMEITGGQSFYKGNELERLFRDVQGGKLHPLPKWDQYQFTGERLLQEQMIDR